MASLTIHLREKFTNDSVVIRADGVEVLREERVTTKLLVGYAVVRTVQVPQGTLRVEVGVPSRNLSRSLTLEVPQDQHLEVWILDGFLDLRVPLEPPAYL